MIYDFLTILGRDADPKQAEYFINRAKNSVLKITNRSEEELNDHLKGIIVDLAIYRYNLRGSEHLNSESFSGASFNYQVDIPENIKTELKCYRKLKVF